MAVITVPQELQTKLGDEGVQALVAVLEQYKDEQRDDLISLVEERFARRVVESEHRLRNELRSEMHDGFQDLQKQIGGFHEALALVRTDFGREITDVRKEIGDVRKEITTLTRWILTVAVAVTVLLPLMQRLAAALFPA